MKRHAGDVKHNRHSILHALKSAIEELAQSGTGWHAVEANECLFERAWKVSRSLPHDEKVIALLNEVRRAHKVAKERATPPDFWDDFQKLKQRDSAGLESGIAFLEADPRFFRSGYISEWLTSFIRCLPLDEAQQERLRHVVLHIVDTRDGREFRYFCRLARCIANDDLRRELEERLNSDDKNIRRRAAWMLAFCKG